MAGHAVPAGLGDAADLLDPCPDVHSLFVHYDQLYFGSTLSAVSVEWSTSRMTRCAGVCRYFPAGGARIVLSEPLLKLRPTRDVKETLLHEMIHAYCFVHGLRDRDPGGHGQPFQAKMREINAATCADSQRPPDGYNITVCHSMVDEVRSYQNHVWRCGRCGNEVRRAMNRRPQPADCRGRAGDACNDPYCGWHVHLRTCGGEYDKVAEPPPKAKKPRTEAAPKRARLPHNRPQGQPHIMAFFTPTAREGGAAEAGRPPAGVVCIDLTQDGSPMPRCPVCEQVLGGSNAELNAHVDACLAGCKTLATPGTG